MNSTELGIKDILSILSCTKKNDLEKISSRIIIDGNSFSEFLFKSLYYRYYHKAIYKPFIPDDVKITNEEYMKAKLSLKNKENSKEVQKLLKKGFQLIKKRRLLVVHFFINISTGDWNMFYWDQRATEKIENHFKKGAHIHFINYLWVNLNISNILKILEQDNPKLPSGLHLCWKDNK